MKIALVDERISPECERNLLLRGIKIIKVPRAGGLGEAICSHPDTVMFAHNGKIISSADYMEEAPFLFSDICELLPDTSFKFTSESFSERYPLDAIFNALVIGSKIFYKEDTVSPAIKEYARATGLTPFPVKQGYPACTVLPLGKSAAITADRGMAKRLRDAGIRVTEISEGHISLPPHKYGFIGGCAGCDGENVYFLGQIESHPDSDIIKAAITAEGLVPVSLSKGMLCDLGRIIFIG